MKGALSPVADKIFCHGFAKADIPLQRVSQVAMKLAADQRKQVAVTEVRSLQVFFLILQKK